MAKILVLTFTNMPGGVLDAFRQGFVEALARSGNEVLVLRSNDFLAEYQNSNRLANSVDSSLLLDYIRDFAPDAAVSMNHSGMFPGLADVLNCPIAVWLLDGPSYLVEPEECRRQNTRYQMLTPVRAFRQDLKDGFGYQNKDVHDLPFATDFQAHDLPFERNIAFIGTFFTGWRLQEIIEKHLEDRELIGKIRALLDSYADDRDTIFSKRVHRFDLADVFSDDFDEAYILNTIAINRRIQVLDAVQDLGLTIFGTSDWPSVMSFSSGLALSFDPTQITSRESLENVYNSSKLNINVSHAQARGGLPWRIFDIMSSNGVLISDYQEDLDLLFGSEVKIPIYRSPSEARQLCVQLLKDDTRRIELANSCQSVIEKAHRFKHRLETLADILQLNLLPGGTGAFNFLDPDLFKKTGNDYLASLTFNTDGAKDADSMLLQIFQSNVLAFDPNNSQQAHTPSDSVGAIHHDFLIPNSLPYMRLDVGEYFSTHSHVALTISAAKQTHGQEPVIREIHLKRDLIAAHQFFWNGNTLSCGFDSYCVFKNPFAGSDVVVSFNSTIKSRI